MIRCTFWRLAPRSRASQATGCGRSAVRMAPRNLPAGAGQAKLGDQPVSGGQHSAVEPEQVENEVGQGIAGRRPLGVAHMSSYILIDIMMSSYYVCIISI